MSKLKKLIEKLEEQAILWDETSKSVLSNGIVANSDYCIGKASGFKDACDFVREHAAPSDKPSKWRVLGDDEIIQEGDFYCYGVDREKFTHDAPVIGMTVKEWLLHTGTDAIAQRRACPSKWRDAGDHPGMIVLVEVPEYEAPIAGYYSHVSEKWFAFPGRHEIDVIRWRPMPRKFRP